MLKHRRLLWFPDFYRVKNLGILWTQAYCCPFPHTCQRGWGRMSSEEKSSGMLVLKLDDSLMMLKKWSAVQYKNWSGTPPTSVFHLCDSGLGKQDMEMSELWPLSQVLNICSWWDLSPCCTYRYFKNFVKAAVFVIRFYESFANSSIYLHGVPSMLGNWILSENCSISVVKTGPFESIAKNSSRDWLNRNPNAFAMFLFHKQFPKIFSLLFFFLFIDL